MEISLLYEIEWAKPWEDGWEYEKHHEALDQIELADELGFHAAWAVEHHFLTEFSHSSAPEVWLGAAAERTDNIRIGQGVVVLTYNHPVRVAERIATLDIISDGRVEFGTGRSSTHDEIGGFQVDPGDVMPMYRESLKLIPELFQDGVHEFDGEYWEMGPREVWPKPIQDPHPPMYRACTQPKSWREAGLDGLGVLGFTLGLEPSSIGNRVDEYKEGIANADPIPKEINDHVGLFTLGTVAETDEAAREIARNAVVWYMDRSFEFYTDFGGAMLEGDDSDVPESYQWYAEASKKADAARETKTKYEHLVDNQMILSGSPETVIEGIKEYERQGVDEILFLLQAGRIAHDDIMSAIELLGNEVIPHV